jgi:hypothetical protein
MPTIEALTKGDVAAGGFPVPLLATLIQAKGPLRAGPRVALRFARINSDMLKLQNVKLYERHG